jgi:hypothetical protein
VSEPGKVIRMKQITRDLVRSMPDALFLFGDNMARRGMGGQAAAMRGEPNAVGVPTKWTPSSGNDAYFTDADGENMAVRLAIVEPFQLARDYLRRGFDVVVPEDGLGTGLAKLSSKAPRIHAYIERHIEALTEGRDPPSRRGGDV